MPRKKKPSYAELESELAQTKRDYSLERWSLLLTLESKPDFVTNVRITSRPHFEGESYEYRLYGSRMSFGGLVVRIFRTDNNDSDFVETVYLSDLETSTTYPYEVQEAIRKVREAHRRIIAKHGYERRVKDSIPRLPDTEVTNL